MHSPSHASCDSSTSSSPLPPAPTSLVSSTPAPNLNVRVNPDGSVKFTRKYEKTGKYSKKKQKSDSDDSHTPNTAAVGSGSESTRIQSISAATEAARRQLFQQQHEQQLSLHASISTLPPNTPAHKANSATPTSSLQQHQHNPKSSGFSPQISHSSHPLPTLSLPLTASPNVANHNTIGSMAVTPQIQNATTHAPQWKPQMPSSLRESSSFSATQQNALPSMSSGSGSSSTTPVQSATYYPRTPSTMRSSQPKPPSGTLSASHAPASAAPYQTPLPKSNLTSSRTSGGTAERQASASAHGHTGKPGKALSEEELHHMKIKRRIQEQLAADHRAVLQPDWKTPFQSIEDAVKRLLPYHVFQYPDADFAGAMRGHLSDDEAALQSLQIFSKVKNLQDRYKRLVKEEDEKSVPSHISHLCTRLLRDEERLQLTATTDRMTALKGVLSELDKKTKEDRDRAERDRRAKDDAKLMSEEAERGRRMQQLFRLQSQQPAVPQSQPSIPSTPLPGQNPQFQPSPTLFQQYAQARSQVLSMAARHAQHVAPTRNPHFGSPSQPSTPSQRQPSRYPITNQNPLTGISQTRPYYPEMNAGNLNSLNVLNPNLKNATNIPEPNVEALTQEQMLLLLAQQHQEVYTDRNGSAKGFGHDS